MKKQEHVYLQGKCKWARLVNPDKYNKWGLLLYPNAESLEKFREMQAEGVKTLISKDDDGYYVRLSRPQQKEARGKLLAFAPPELVDASGQPCKDQPGNGSDVTCKVTFYKYMSPLKVAGAAIRLEAVRIDNLIPWEEKSFGPEATKQIGELNNQPAQVATSF